VIDEALPHSSVELGPEWALQSSTDWLEAMEATVSKALGEAQINPDAVIGIGIDFTASTVLPATAAGKPLRALDAYSSRPHAWPKLWKHHAAQAQADRVNELASERGEEWLPRYGGRLSSEWLIPKALEMLEEDPEIYEAADYIVEGADWVVWQLTDRLTRNSCTAGYKATWSRSNGFPPTAFLAELHPRLVNLYADKLAGPIVAPGERVGGLTEEWANRLGIAAGTPVAAPLIDAHAAVIGGGVTEPNVMYMIMGTSTCHLLMSEKEQFIRGVAGVVEGGILPRLFAYEAGQAGVGDIFAWFVENSVPPAYHAEAQARQLSLHDVLTEYAQKLEPGESGLLALDWWNGNRSTLMDADLSGLLLGATLATKPEDVYRALIEATAFGTRVIIEAFTDQGVPVDRIVAGGGLTQNQMLMQIYSDVIGRRIDVIGSELASALGAAMLGAVAAGSNSGGYDTLKEAAGNMAPTPTERYRWDSDHKSVYSILYAEYCRLYDYFGRGENDVMKGLREVRASH
jgi:L-ribulokinase